MDFNTLDDMRKSRRYTIVQFCEEVGIDQSTYHKWKTNPDKMSVATANRIAEVLELGKREKAKLLG